MPNSQPLINEQFQAFHQHHPEVWDTLVRLTREVQSRGFKHYGIKSLWERVRWHFQVDLDMGEDFKLNNNYHSRYARKLMRECPEFQGFFKLRALRSD